MTSVFVLEDPGAGRNTEIVDKGSPLANATMESIQDLTVPLKREEKGDRNIESVGGRYSPKDTILPHLLLGGTVYLPDNTKYTFTTRAGDEIHLNREVFRCRFFYGFPSPPYASRINYSGLALTENGVRRLSTDVAESLYLACEKRFAKLQTSLEKKLRSQIGVLARASEETLAQLDLSDSSNDRIRFEFEGSQFELARSGGGRRYSGSATRGFPSEELTAVEIAAVTCEQVSAFATNRIKEPVAKRIWKNIIASKM